MKEKSNKEVTALKHTKNIFFSEYSKILYKNIYEIKINNQNKNTVQLNIFHLNSYINFAICTTKC